jgi:6-phosphogluconate dehydrogenase (decarboxylating)
MIAAISEGVELLEKSDDGSVIRLWLIERTEHAFAKNAKLDEIKGIIPFIRVKGNGQLNTLQTMLKMSRCLSSC